MELVQRSCQEKTCSKILSRGLLQGSCQESFFRDLVRRPGGREQRSCSEIYYRELEQRSSVEISCRDLVQVALQRDPAQQLLQRTCQGDIAHDLLQRSSHWELAESNRNLASLLPEATFEWTPCFGYYRVTLVLLAWSHWWFWVLSTFPFGILTAHCLGSLAKVFFFRKLSVYDYFLVKLVEYFHLHLWSILGCTQQFWDLFFRVWITRHHRYHLRARDVTWKLAFTHHGPASSGDHTNNFDLSHLSH